MDKATQAVFGVMFFVIIVAMMIVAMKMTNPLYVIGVLGVAFVVYMIVSIVRYR